jgi:hypothetical protein
MLPVMANTPNRMMRIPDPLWTRFGEMCAEEGTTRTAEVIACMERRIRAYERRRQSAAAVAAHDDRTSE